MYYADFALAPDSVQLVTRELLLKQCATAAAYFVNYRQLWQRELIDPYRMLWRLCGLR